MNGKVCIHTNSLLHFKRAQAYRRQTLRSTPQKLLLKNLLCERFMTLKQACSWDYPRAQGAFKDSMIH